MASNKQIDFSGLEKEYREIAGLARSFAEELSKQLLKLVDGEGIALAFPMQQRIKSWDSIAGKFERLTLVAKSVQQVQDLIGLRIVPLFRRDIERVELLIRGRLEVIRDYDTGDRLKDDQFGYASKHFVVRLPSSWLVIPSFENMGQLQAEIQLRTLAQHMWAEASHVLQYKREDTVPKSMRRALYRASALLETLDLEFERILSDREVYREGADIGLEDAVLDVDLLEKTLDAALPVANKEQDEPYAELQYELLRLGVNTVGELRALTEKHLHDALKRDEASVRRCLDDLNRGEPVQGAEPERIRRGVYFTHVGLLRVILEEVFGWERLHRAMRHEDE